MGITPFSQLAVRMGYFFSKTHIPGDCIRTETPLTLEDAQRVVARYVAYYNEVRLHSAIGYVTPKDKLEGRQKSIFAERDRKLAEARERRKAQRQAALAAPGPEPTTTVT